MLFGDPRTASIRRGALFIVLVASAVSAHALTLNDLGNGARSFDDGVGNSSMVTIEHISSSSNELDQMVADLEGQGYTVNRLADLDGQINVNFFEASDYGYNTVGHRVLGMTWDVDVLTPDALSLNDIIYNTVTPIVGGGFNTYWYSDNTNPNYPFNPLPQYSDTDNDGVDDAFRMTNNYGWWMDNPGYTDIRYDLTGFIGSDGSVNIADGIKMTNTATIAPVPEPASLAALTLGAIGVVRRRKANAR